MKNIVEKLIKKSSEPKLIEDAFEFAKEAYKDKFRISGENYAEHAARVAQKLDLMGLSPTIVALGFLHDILDDVPSPFQQKELKEIERRFGKELAFLVENVSALARVRYSLAINVKEKKLLSKEKIENLRKMFLALAGDLRVVLVELVSRLDGLNFLHYLPQEQQKLYAIETLEIFAPVANRLGLSQIRRQLEDLSFYYLFPERYKWLESNIKEPYEQREKFLKKFIPRLKKIFKAERVSILDINWRAKSYWSCYQKLLTHNMDFSKIHDLLALRIIVKDTPACYKTLGILHKYYRPISEEINDYIAKPKPNGYRSLHTTVFLNEDEITEIQIRTEDMHKEAEYGVCAHWSYKEKIDLKKDEEKFAWVNQAPQLWKTYKIDLFSKQIFVFTPRGDVIVLPKNSTPVDFAYAVHSDIGNHCQSAKVNGKIAPLSKVLENGDVVEIVINKNKTPSSDWLRFVKSSMAKTNIKKFIDQPKQGWSTPISGFIKRKFIAISEIVKGKKEQKPTIEPAAKKPREIYLAGQKGMLVHIAKCCNPEPGDKVAAYLTKHRAAVLHKISCANFKKIAEAYPEKIIPASWQ